jgi:hypothetical protein
MAGNFIETDEKLGEVDVGRTLSLHYYYLAFVVLTHY